MLEADDNSLEWEFGDGAAENGWWVNHFDDTAGSYSVSLIATDNEGASTTHEITIEVS